jgi:hypothetical protein
MPGFFDVITDPLGLEYLDPDHSQAIKDGVEEFNEIWAREYYTIKMQSERGNDRLENFFKTTRGLLMYELDSRQLYTLIGFIKAWKNIGKQQGYMVEKIVNGLNARLEQLISPSQNEDPIESRDDQFVVKNDEAAPVTIAPVTMKSMKSVAKILRYINVFYKVARG